MGYVFNSDCSLQTRGNVFFKAIFLAGGTNGVGKLPVALFVFLTFYLSLSVASPSEPLHYQLASDPYLHGKGKDGECMDYALALSSRLAEYGIHGRLIFYRWHIRGTETGGSHVFVFYRLADSSEWIVDNEIPHPRKVPAGTSLMDLVFLLSDTKTAPVDVELQNGLNHLSFF
jgi:hypothetical protein